MKARVTMEDVAREVGVSRMTVSLVLRNSPRVSGKTKKQVQEAVERLGYVNDPYLRSLSIHRQVKQGKSQLQQEIVALILVGFDEKQKSWERIKETKKALEVELAARGMQLDLFEAKNEKEVESFHEIILARGIRGCFLCAAPNIELQRCAIWEDVAVVVLYGRTHGKVVHHRVMPDLKSTMRACVEYMHKKKGSSGFFMERV